MLHQETPHTRHQRLDANAQASQLANTLSLGTELSPEQREILRRYTGRGSLQAGSGEASLAAIQEYYTPDLVARIIWQKVGIASHYQQVTVLEGSCGIGNFLPWVNNELVTGVEIDATASKIAQLLYPDAKIINCAFEDFDPHARFDVVVGNPPFGARGARRLDDKPDLEDYPMYFLEASLDRLNDGGILALIMPSGYTSSARHLADRAVLMARARLRGVYRLPHSTFEDSGAKLETDVLFLEKRPWQVGDVLAELARAYGSIAVAAAHAINNFERDYLQGTFFQTHPEFLTAGVIKETRFGRDVVDGDLEAACDQMSHTKLLEVSPAPMTFGALHQALEQSHWAHGRVQTLCIEAVKRLQGRGYPLKQGAEHGGKVLDIVARYTSQSTTLAHIWRPAPKESPLLRVAKSTVQWLERFFEFRRDGNAAPEITEEARLKALSASADFLAQHGNPHQLEAFQILTRAQPRLHLLTGAITKNGDLSPDLTTPKVLTLERERDFDSTKAKLLRHKALTAENVAFSLEWSYDQALQTLLEDEGLALTPNGTWESWGSYANGNAFHISALSQAQAHTTTNPAIQARLEQQIAKLESIAQWRSIEDIELSGREGFIPSHVVKAWIETEYPHLKAEYDQQWHVSIVDRSERRALRITKPLAERDAKMLESYLRFEFKTELIDGAGEMSKTKYLGRRKAAMDEAFEKQARLKASFTTFVATDLEHRELIEREYNSRYMIASALEPTEWLDLSHWRGMQPHRYQVQEASLRVERGNGVSALGTGLGKTLVAGLILEGLLSKGMASRVAIPVPKPLLLKYLREVVEPLPHRRIVIIGITKVGDQVIDDTPEIMRQKLLQLSFGAFDAGIMSHETYRRLQLGSETLKAVMRDEALDRTKQHHKLKNADKKPSDYSFTKDLARFESNVMDVIEVEHPIQGINWEDLGIDAIITDEAGVFRNLHIAPQVLGKKLAFIGSGAESGRALDNFVKARYTSRISHNTATPIFMLTATPADNSPLELYSLLKPIAAEAFSEIGIHGTEQFIDRFCVIESVIYPDFAGNLTVRPGVTSFKNMHELRGILNRYITHATASMVGLEMPSIEIHEHAFDLSELQEANYSKLRDEANALLQASRFDKGTEVLRLFGAMRGLALDPAFFTQDNFSFNPRYAYAAYLSREAVKTGGQVLCFLDWGAPAERDEHGRRTNRKAPGPDAFERLAQEMESLGIPKARIAIVTASRAPGAKRQEIIDRYNDGQFDVLIATRGSLGVGGDLQHGTTDIIHVDLPPSPGAWDQTNGRGARQGNTNQSVRVHVLLAKGTLDGLLYAIMRGKRSWREQLFESNAREIANSEMLSYEDMLTALAPDPVAARAKLEVLRFKIDKENQLEHKRSQMRQVALCLTAWQNLELAIAKADRRKKGHTETDKVTIARLKVALERYQKQALDATGTEYQDAIKHGGFMSDLNIFTVNTAVRLKNSEKKGVISGFYINDKNRLIAKFTIDQKTTFYDANHLCKA